MSEITVAPMFDYCCTESTGLLSRQENDTMTDVDIDILQELIESYIDDDNKLEALNQKIEEIAFATFMSFYNSAIQMIVAGMSHELKSPLQSVAASLEIMNDCMENDDAIDRKTIKECIDVASQARRTMSNIIGVMSLCGRELNELEIKQVDFDSMMEEIISVSKYREEYKSHKIEINYHSNFNDFEDIEFYTLPSFLYHIITNIISNSCNAITYKRNNGTVEERTDGIIDIRCFYNEENNVLEMEIEDNGIGIKDDTVDKIFMPFYSHRLARDSYGLGLFIARAMLLKIEGSIYVKETRYGKTVMSIVLKNLVSPERH